MRPVALTHSLSGRKVLFVNPAFAQDFGWQPGSVAFWDNRATWHLARNDFQGHRRELHRITIVGEALP